MMWRKQTCQHRDAPLSHLLAVPRLRKKKSETFPSSIPLIFFIIFYCLFFQLQKNEQDINRTFLLNEDWIIILNDRICMIRPTFGTAVLPGVIPSVAPEVILTTGFTSIFARFVVPLSILSGILAHELFS